MNTEQTQILELFQDILIFGFFLLLWKLWWDES